MQVRLLIDRRQKESAPIFMSGSCSVRTECFDELNRLYLRNTVLQAILNEMKVTASVAMQEVTQRKYLLNKKDLTGKYKK